MFIEYSISQDYNNIEISLRGILIYKYWRINLSVKKTKLIQIML